LNTATRGGLPNGKLVVLGGAPGSGKTTLAVQLARHFASTGVPIGLLACDESLEAMMIRWGQQHGIDRSSLEDGIPNARLQLEAHFKLLPSILFADAGDPGASIESLSLGLMARFGPGVVIVDSIQSAPALGAADSTGARGRIDRTVEALKNAARRGHVVIATCELARSAYRSRDNRDNVEDIAAFKESSSVEYGADLLLVLRADRNVENTVDVSMPKNRCGRKTPFRLTLDHTLDTFTEVALPAKTGPGERLADDMKKIRDVIASRPHREDGADQRTVAGRDRCARRGQP
jgi:archaellum biogenesis ATPase FlaH